MRRLSAPTARATDTDLSTRPGGWCGSRSCRPASCQLPRRSALRRRRLRQGTAGAPEAARDDLGARCLNLLPARHAGAPPFQHRSRVRLQRLEARGTHGFGRELMAEAALSRPPLPAAVGAAPPLLPQAVHRDDDLAARQAFAPPRGLAGRVWLKRAKADPQHHPDRSLRVDSQGGKSVRSPAEGTTSLATPDGPVLRIDDPPAATAAAFPPAGTARIGGERLHPGSAHHRRSLIRVQLSSHLQNFATVFGNTHGGPDRPPAHERSTGSN